jgi:predicted HTH transcriptional regulator
MKGANMPEEPPNHPAKGWPNSNQNQRPNPYRNRWPNQCQNTRPNSCCNRWPNCPGIRRRITNSQVADVTGANRNTVKKHLQMLVSASHLVQHGSGKATWYSRV